MLPNKEIKTIEISLKSGKDKHQYPEIGHTQGEILEKPRKKVH
jgi:hypothetical protein